MMVIMVMMSKILDDHGGGDVVDVQNFGLLFKPRHVRVLKENIQDQFEFSYDICYECKDYGETLGIWNHEPLKRRDPLRLRLDYELWNRDFLPWKTHHGVRGPKL